MIIWQGWGFLAAVVPLVIGLIGEMAVESSVGDSNFYQTSWWPILVACTMGAAVIFVVANRLEEAPAKIVIDKETGKEIRLAKPQTLFFIPLKYWAAIWLCIGIGVAIKRYA